MVEGETGEITYEPLRALSLDDLLTCVAYAGLKNLRDMARYPKGLSEQPNYQDSGRSGTQLGTSLATQCHKYKEAVDSMKKT